MGRGGEAGRQSGCARCLPAADRVAVEADGPTHFTRNLVPLGQHPSSGPGSAAGPLEGTEEEPTAAAGDGSAAQRMPVGATLLKQRLLEQRGWQVVRVDTEAWERLRGRGARREYLLAAGVGAALAAAQAARKGAAAAADDGDAAAG